ncbi:hypothetical protein KR222_005260 [Zaprionus bogoriensis]|nr:hypothetical protein KR222_005260 [Zaprionus bogoriensis]
MALIKLPWQQQQLPLPLPSPSQLPLTALSPLAAQLGNLPRYCADAVRAREQERASEREREKNFLEQGNRSQTSVALRASDCPGAAGNKIFDASCAACRLPQSLCECQPAELFQQPPPLPPLPTLPAPATIKAISPPVTAAAAAAPPLTPLTPTPLSATTATIPTKKLVMVTRTKKIFVGGLSAPTTLEDVKSYFEQFGPVASQALMTLTAIFLRAQRWLQQQQQHPMGVWHWEQRHQQKSNTSCRAEARDNCLFTQPDDDDDDDVDYLPGSGSGPG